ncbi:MAG: type IV toxin-antitoxin system AbiEi family antitoxin domain-containing protein [Deltaproteobacteria bacterium]|nr:type IV toxin-antitoxin system AbiEi family antitoxin domain-containing protein [Deltaproteobacteria bacterium]
MDEIEELKQVVLNGLSGQGPSRLDMVGHMLCRTNQGAKAILDRLIADGKVERLPRGIYRLKMQESVF